MCACVQALEKLKLYAMYNIKMRKVKQTYAATAATAAASAATQLLQPSERGIAQQSFTLMLLLLLPSLPSLLVAILFWKAIKKNVACCCCCCCRCLRQFSLFVVVYFLFHFVSFHCLLCFYALLRRRTAQSTQAETTQRKNALKRNSHSGRKGALPATRHARLNVRERVGE